MRHFLLVFAAFSLVFAQPAAQKKGGPPPIVPKAEELTLVRSKVGELEELLRAAERKGVNPDWITDVAVYAKAGQFLLEFPQTFFTQDGIQQALTVLDEGIARGRALGAGNAPWAAAKGRKIHAYRSDLDGSVQPYGVTIPDGYDGTKPVRLYVWLHGRDQTLTEASFLFKFPKPNKGLTYAAADEGQITLDCYGRWNNANHWAGEVDVFEAINAVSRRYRIDPKRIILRGFSLGGAGAWHIALQHPDRFAAAEIGAGTYPRRASMGGFPVYQQGPLHIWENIIDWSLNAFNIPIAGHDGDNDSQVATIPPDRENPGRGQLESSLRVRAQLAKEGFPSEGEENYWHAKGTPSIFLISEKTGHSISPLVRTRIDAFLKEHGDKGIVSPQEVRFVTYTTRYNRAHWVSIDGLAKHYERAEVQAKRDSSRNGYDITTKNVTALTLRETEAAHRIRIDGQSLRVRPGAAIRLFREGAAWRTGAHSDLRKTHGLQGPIDDAFLEPFLLVRPTGTPWNVGAHEQALRVLKRFDRVYARYYRSHPRIKDDKDVTAADMARYHVVLFGDPGSNQLLAKLARKLPVVWTKESITAGKERFAAANHLPALIYPNPLQPGKYVVINSGLTIDEREYHGDYSMPKWGDIAVLKVDGTTDTPEPAFAALFDEQWRLP
ncbi:MAG TPA: prolyl oligopeptidase family serine peptidase [Bryobacteraceae bacterium]|nr:prolyl oligopeptidase family serine peptidase [Bryobacteraceae bacterium]